MCLMDTDAWNKACALKSSDLSLIEPYFCSTFIEGYWSCDIKHCICA